MTPNPDPAPPGPAGPGPTHPALLVFAAVLAAALVIAVVDVGAARRHSPVDLAEVCAAYSHLKLSLNTTRLPGQVAVRAAASRLADVAGQYPLVEQQGAAPVQSAGEGIVAVLRTPYASTRDLFSAIKPVAVACGEPWQFRGGTIADHRLAPPPATSGP